MKNSIRLLFYIAVLIFLVSIDKKLESLVKLELTMAEYTLQQAAPSQQEDANLRSAHR